jgi:hypothetical protein
MNKITIGILIFLFVSGMAGASFFFLSQEKVALLKEGIFETDGITEKNDLALEENQERVAKEKIEIDGKDFNWKNFWEKTREKGCYDVYEIKNFVGKSNFDNVNCPYVDFDRYTCSDIEDFVREYPRLHNLLLDDENYAYMWENREICGASLRLSIGKVNVQNRNFIILTQLGGMNEVEYPGSTKIFEIKDGKYSQILNKEDYLIGISSICGNKWFVGGIPMYLFEEGTCCPSNYAAFYYEIKENELVIHKIIDGHGNDISDIYFDLTPCD